MTDTREPEPPFAEIGAAVSKALGWPWLPDAEKLYATICDLFDAAYAARHSRAALEAKFEVWKQHAETAEAQLQQMRNCVSTRPGDERGFTRVCIGDRTIYTTGDGDRANELKWAIQGALDALLASPAPAGESRWRCGRCDQTEILSKGKTVGGRIPFHSRHCTRGQEHLRTCCACNGGRTPCSEYLAEFERGPEAERRAKREAAPASLAKQIADSGGFSENVNVPVPRAATARGGEETASICFGLDCDGKCGYRGCPNAPLNDKEEIGLSGHIYHTKTDTPNWRSLAERMAEGLRHVLEVRGTLGHGEREVHTGVWHEAVLILREFEEANK